VWQFSSHKETTENPTKALIFYEQLHAEADYYLRRYRHKSYYSLDRGDGIEHDSRFVSLSPCEIYKRKVTVEQLHAAIIKSKGVNESAVRDGFDRGLRNIQRFLKNYL
ncbi:MAG: sigma-70 family RNA polymerase sigma factor, partial [Lawsonibacter sp.]|nr:sigma-70 family RNA polymerase sigma factor [Lawsonibacter sp.]